MKIFLAAIIGAAILGGLVGGELMDRTFSITGAAIGGIGLAVVLLGLGAWFTHRDERKKGNVQLTPEIRGVFDRMLATGQAPATAPRATPKLQTSQPRLGKSDEDDFLSIASGLIAVQFIPKYLDPREAFPSLMTNKAAAGYLFGFHDALLQRLELRSSPNHALSLIKKSYEHLFGKQAGTLLHSMSLQYQDDPDFLEGRLSGGNELIAYMDTKEPAFGLNRILFLGAKA